MGNIQTTTMPVDESKINEEFVSAARDSQEEKVKSLLKEGVDVNSTDRLGHTGLHLASYQGHLNIVKILLENNADLEAGAVKSQYERPIHYAAKNDQTEILEILLEKGAKLNATDINGATPLHLAARQGKINSVRFLIKQPGVEIDKQNDREWYTALHMASYYGHDKVVEELINNEADIEREDSTGATPLYLAVIENKLDAARTLLESGANPLPTNKEQSNATALHMASWFGYTDMIKLLHEYKADINAKDKDKMTALYFAILNRQYHSARILVGVGADITQDVKDVLKDRNPILLEELEKKSNDFREFSQNAGQTLIKIIQDGSKTGLVKALEGKPKENSREGRQ
ncbi:MAG: ankyrin repeat domain-containing protein [Alphaproteobacteria bacterium]